jgi:hypothetical protein
MTAQQPLTRKAPPASWAQTMSPSANLVARLEQAGYEPRPTGPGSWDARCPDHQGSKRNLSLREGSGGKALVHCSAKLGREADR